MGNRPTSQIIYGFEYIHDWESDDPTPDFDYDKSSTWEKRCAELEGAETWAGKMLAVAKHGQHVEWGYLEEPSHAFGFVVVSGDWESAETIDLASLVPPANAEEKLAALCEFYGVKPQAPKWLLITSSYG